MPLRCCLHLNIYTHCFCWLHRRWHCSLGPSIHLSIFVTEPAEPGRAEEDENASDLPTAVISPTLVAKHDPVLAEVAQSAEKFLDAVVKVSRIPASEYLLAPMPKAHFLLNNHKDVRYFPFLRCLLCSLCGTSSQVYFLAMSLLPFY